MEQCMDEMLAREAARREVLEEDLVRREISEGSRLHALEEGREAFWGMSSLMFFVCGVYTYTSMMISWHIFVLGMHASTGCPWLLPVSTLLGSLYLIIIYRKYNICVYSLCSLNNSLYPIAYILYKGAWVAILIAYLFRCDSIPQCYLSLKWHTALCWCMLDL